MKEALFSQKPVFQPDKGFKTLVGFFLAPFFLFAQNTTPPADTAGRLKIETSLYGEYFQLRGGDYGQKLSGSVRLRQEKTLVYCDTALLFGDDAVLRGNVVIEQGDSVKVFADSVLYFGATRLSDLFGDVALENGRQRLFTRRLRYDMANKIATYQTGGTLDNGKSQLTSRRGYYFVNQKQAHFKGDVLITDPEATVRTDTMTFDTEGQVAHFVAPTRITQRNSKIYTEGGFYDLENDFAEFDVNPQYERAGQRGRARKMRYSGATQEYVLEGDAYIEEAQKKVNADVIRYNIETEQAVLRGNAHYRDSTQDITGVEIRYDDRNKRYQLLGRGRVSDPPSIIEADSLDFNDQLGEGLALGNVVWQDTAANVTVLSWRMDYNKQSQYLNAFGGFGPQGAAGRPLMKSLIDRDTLYLAADTLNSFKPDSASDVRLLLAYHDVRIFKNNLQAVCDSLKFSTEDSIFWFFKIRELPLIWSDTSQFSGDTIRMLLRNKRLDRIWLRQNAFVINSEDEQFYNQIKGRNTTVFFRDNEADNMFVEGNAEAVYYALDDRRAYIGVNETQCSEMRLFFADNRVESVKFYTEPKGKFSPMEKTGGETRKLDGFFWEKKRRPRSVREILVKNPSGE